MIENKELEIKDVAPVVGFGSVIVLLAFIDRLYKQRKQKTFESMKLEDNKRIFFISKEGEYNKQRNQQKYFNSLISLQPQEPMSHIFNKFLECDPNYNLSFVISSIFRSPITKIPNPLNFIEIPVDKSGPFKYPYYPSNNKYLSKSKGLCLLNHDINLETKHLDNFYPEWNSATYKKNIQTGKAITPTYHFGLIVTRRGCFGNVWKNFRNIEETYKKIQIENKFLQERNTNNEQERKNLIQQHKNEILEIEMKFKEEKENLINDIQKIELYLEGERKLRMEKEKESEIYLNEIEKLNQKIRQLEILNSNYLQKQQQQQYNNNGFNNNHINFN